MDPNHERTLCAVAASAIVAGVWWRTRGWCEAPELANPTSRPPSGSKELVPTRSLNRHERELLAAEEHDEVKEVDHLNALDRPKVFKIPHIREYRPDGDAQEYNVRRRATSVGEADEYTNYMEEDDVVLGCIVRASQYPTSTLSCFARAGPRAATYFRHDEVTAAIVTCGGLCPGMNDVIRSIYKTLRNDYGCRRVYGVRGGFAGFYSKDSPPTLLTAEGVENIHHSGGTVLASSRGGFDATRIINAIVTRGINQVFIIGGDGTHRGAQALYQEVRRRGLRIAVAGVPKTIDNDIDMIDRSFGFNTSVEEAVKAIGCAYTEATCVAPAGIGIVKLMGREAGFIAVHATLASGNVDLCLIPEIPVELYGENGCLAHLERVLAQQRHAVVVVAEGAGGNLLQGAGTVDESGNKRLPPIGEFMKNKVAEHFAGVGVDVTIKFMDPSYMIRSVKANSGDAIYCLLLGQSVVHGAMAGFTGFSVGLKNSQIVYMPITALVRNSPRGVNPVGVTMERLLSITGQPKIIPDGVEIGLRRVTAKTVF